MMGSILTTRKEPWRVCCHIKEIFEQHVRRGRELSLETQFITCALVTVTSFQVQKASWQLSIMEQNVK